MDLRDAERMAEAALLKWGLPLWTFKFDNAKRRFGRCSSSKKEISLSRYLTALNDEAQVRDTILHEVAHALAGHAAGHGPAWKRWCLTVGANPSRCYDTAEVEAVAARYEATCETCGKVWRRHRAPKHVGACTACCRALGNGKFDKRFALAYRDTTTGRYIVPITSRTLTEVPIGAVRLQQAASTIHYENGTIRLDGF